MLPRRLARGWIPYIRNPFQSYVERRGVALGGLADIKDELRTSAVENAILIVTTLSRKRGIENGDLAVINVLDQGSGVPQPALANIFHPFYRIADARDRKSGGTGLGLSITQRALEIHGGTVTAATIAGGGLSVEIVLPIAPDTNDSDLQSEPLVDKEVG